MLDILHRNAHICVHTELDNVYHFQNPNAAQIIFRGNKLEIRINDEFVSFCLHSESRRITFTFRIKANNQIVVLTKLHELFVITKILWRKRGMKRLSFGCE